MRFLITLVMALGILLSMLTQPVMAQTTTKRSVELNWEDSNGPTALFDVERVDVSCTHPTVIGDTAVWTVKTTNLALRTWEDKDLLPGDYCYRVRSKLGTKISAPSNTAVAAIELSVPTNLKIKVVTTIAVTISNEPVVVAQSKSGAVEQSK